MYRFKKNGIKHCLYYELQRGKQTRCHFYLQIAGKGHKQVCNGEVLDYQAVGYILKNNDFKTHKQARELLIQEKFLH